MSEDWRGILKGLSNKVAAPEKDVAPKGGIRPHWDEFYGVAPERLPRGLSPLVKRFGPGLKQRLEERGLPARLLELGPGLGEDLRAFKAEGLECVGFDITAQGFKAGGLLQNSEIPLVLGDIRRPLPFRAGAFGACSSHLVLSCDFGEEEIRGCLKEIARILAPGGVLLLGVRSISDPTYTQLGQPGAGPARCGGVGLHFFSRRSLREYLGGFSDLSIIDEGGCLLAAAINTAN